MKSNKLILISYFSILVNTAYSQCYGTNQYPPTAIDATSSWSDISNCNYAGEFAVINVVSGNTYQFSTCSSDGSSISYDTELRLTDMTVTNLLASNNDYCGTQSFVSWQANFTGQVKIHLTQALCLSNQICSNIRVRSISPPSNDDCSNAITLPVYGATCGSVTQGTVQGVLSNGSIPFGGCGGTDNGDVWYKFTATSTSHNINLNCSSNFDGVIEFRSGCPGSNTLISCKNGLNLGQSETLLAQNLTVGNTYYIRIYDFNGINVGSYNFDICITTTGVFVPNDNCNGAELLTATLNCTSPVSGSTFGATPTVENICGSPATVDLWYYFIASATSQNIEVTPSSAFDPVIELKSSASPCGNWTNLFCQDASGPGQIETLNATNLTIGNLYYIRIAHYGNTAPSTSTFNLCLTTSGPPNDNCQSAIALPVYEGEFCDQSTVVNLFGATQSLPDNCGGFSNANDVWFKFTAQNSSHIITSTYGSGIYPVIDVRSGSCNGVSIDCGLGQSGTNQITLNNLSVGQVYFVRVYHGQGGSTQTNYSTNICVTTQNDASVDENYLDQELIIFPNPASDVLHISYDGAIERLTIIDMKGAVVYTNTENKKEHKLPLSLESGFYMVLLQTENGTFRKELVIQR